MDSTPPQASPAHRIAIIGSGALACLFGGRLQAVAQVTLLGTWPEQLAALRVGLTIHELDGSQSHAPLVATANPHSVGHVDFVLVLVKSTQTQSAIGRIAPLLTPSTLIITLQNGLGNVETLAQAFGPHAVAAGVTSTGATILKPGHVRHAGDGPTRIAAHPAQTAGCRVVVDLLQQAGFDAQIVDDIGVALWQKLTVNAAINPLTALLGVPNGYLATDPAARSVLTAAAEEVATVAAAHAIALSFPAGRSAAEHALHVATATATNRSSMLQDIDRGAPTEIDAICGAVVRAGAEAGVSTPVNAQLLASVQALEQNRPNSQWNITIGDRIIRLRKPPARPTTDATP